MPSPMQKMLATYLVDQPITVVKTDLTQVETTYKEYVKEDPTFKNVKFYIYKECATAEDPNPVSIEDTGANIAGLFSLILNLNTNEPIFNQMSEEQYHAVPFEIFDINRPDEPNLNPEFQQALISAAESTVFATAGLLTEGFFASPKPHHEVVSLANTDSTASDLGPRSVQCTSIEKK